MRKSLSATATLLALLSSSAAWAACPTTITVLDGLGGSKTFCTGTDGGTGLFSKFMLVDGTAGANIAAVNSSGQLAIQPLVAGAAIVGKVGIDQTTPGTTNLVAAGQNGNWTARVVGNGGATVDAAIGAGAAPTNMLVGGGIYNSSALTPSSGQSAALQLDSAANLKVNVATSGYAQGSTTSGQNESLIAGAVTTSAPSYTTAQTSPLSLTVGGALRSDLSTIVGTATDVNSGTKSAGTLRVVLATDQPQLTNKLLVTPDANAAVNVAQVGGTAVVADPCHATVKLYAPISQTANAKLVTKVSAKKNYVCSIMVIGADAENVSLVEGTQTTNPCDTSVAAVIGGTTAAAGPNLAANDGFTMGNGAATIASGGGTNVDVCLFQSGSGRVAGVLTYVQQ